MNLASFYAAASVVLLLTVLVALVRVMLGQAPATRILGVQLFGTAGIGLFYLLGTWAGVRGLGDVALILALLAAVAVITFAQTGRDGEAGREEDR